MRRPLPLALLLLALSPAAAHAASIDIAVSADPLEDRPITFTSSAVTDGQPGKVFARFNPGRPDCTPTYQGSTGENLFFSDSPGAVDTRTFRDPGPYRICAWLQQTSSSNTAYATKVIDYDVRANNARLAIQAPATGIVGAEIPVTLTGSTDVGRALWGDEKLAGAGPCGASSAAEPATQTFAFNQPAISAFSVPRLAGPFSTPGLYRLCAWVQEASNDPVAEAAASADIRIVPPKPILRGLDISPTSFAALGSGRSVTDSFRASYVRFTLENYAARVRFTVARRTTGRRVGSSCRKTSRSNRNRKRCTRYVARKGGFTIDGRKGFNSFRFSGRIGGKRLARATYRLYAKPSNEGGTGQTLRHTFRIIKKR